MPVSADLRKEIYNDEKFGGRSVRGTDGGN